MARVNIEVSEKMNAERQYAQWVWSNLRDRVIINVDDSVEISGDDLGDLAQLLEVKLAVVDEAVESDGCEVAHRHLIGRSVLHYLRAKIAALDRTKVL